MKYFPLVWAGIWRKPWENILVLLAIIAAFTLISVMIGLNLTVRQLVALAPMDRLWVSPRFEKDAPPFGFPLALGIELSRMRGVVGVAATHGFSGYHVDPHNPVSIEFVDQGMRTVWSEGPISTKDWDALFAMPSGILVSAKAARKWNLKKGDIFTITVSGDTPTRVDGGNTWDFEVLGLVPDGWRSGANGFIIGNLSYLENAEPANMRGFGYGYEVAVANSNRATAISAEIDRHFANSATATMTVPKRVNQEAYINRNVGTASITGAIAVGGLGMILLLTGNAIARSVQERIPEFAILQTMGYRHGQLMLLVFVESAIPCLIGAAVSAALANVLEKWSRYYLPRELVSFMTAPIPWLPVLGWIFGLAITLALASSVIPIRRLRHQDVISALAGR